MQISTQNVQLLISEFLCDVTKLAPPSDATSLTEAPDCAVCKQRAK